MFPLMAPVLLRPTSFSPILKFFVKPVYGVLQIAPHFALAWLAVALFSAYACRTTHWSVNALSACSGLALVACSSALILAGATRMDVETTGPGGAGGAEGAASCSSVVTFANDKPGALFDFDIEGRELRRCARAADAAEGAGIFGGERGAVERANAMLVDLGAWRKGGCGRVSERGDRSSGDSRVGGGEEGRRED